MQKLRKLFPLMGAILALALVSCGSDSDDGSETATQQKTAGSISYATTSVEKTTADEAFTNALTKTGDGTVTYASSKTDVAEVNTQTGLVTIKGAGETTITATVADSDTYTYATKTASYTLTVTAADTTPQKTAGSISYATTTVSKTTADGVFTNELTKTGDGTVTYASSKETVATVNEDGEVTIKGAGTATITATVADSDTYTYATKTASYTLTVTAADTTPQKTAGSISYATTSVSKTTDEGAFTNTLTKTGNGTVSYTSDNTAVATVNEDGEVTIKGAGTATITATVADSDTYTYATKTASYTLTITQAVTYIGSKAPTEAKAVGDIVFTDGSATPYSADLTLTAEQKAAAVAVIFYAGSASDTLGAKTLGVGLVQGTNLAWARYTDSSDKADGYSNSIAGLVCTPSASGRGKAGDTTVTFTGTTDGRDSLTTLKKGITDYSATNYPAWDFVENYATTAGLTGTYADGWYMPSIAELCKLYQAKTDVNNALSKITGTTQMSTSNWYCSSSQIASSSMGAWTVDFGSGYLSHYGSYNTYSVCAVRAFN